MAEQWLIDGYNLLYAQSSKSSPNPLSREELFSKVAGFASFKKTHVLLVLDGSRPATELEGHATAYFKVVYSMKVSADAYIERYLFEHREAMRLVVVTDDRAISNIGRGGGAQVLSTSHFSGLLQDSAKENADQLRKEAARGHGFHRPFEDKLKDL